MPQGSLFQKALQQVPQDTNIFVGYSVDIVERISSILSRQEKTQKDLARALGKSESEISKWMSGNHNFTLKTIAKIEAILGEKLLNTPSSFKTAVEAKPGKPSFSSQGIPSQNKSLFTDRQHLSYRPKEHQAPKIVRGNFRRVEADVKIYVNVS